MPFRLKFFNLKDDTGLNALSPSEKLDIWVPELVFPNTENRLGTLVDDDSSITVVKKGNYTRSDISDVENRQFYTGEENKITLSRFYNIRFLCDYRYLLLRCIDIFSFPKFMLDTYTESDADTFNMYKNMT